MSKHWNPKRQTVALQPAPRPSRIRRDPALVKPIEKQVVPPSREQEMVGGAAGIILFAITVVVVVIGISMATIFHEDPAVAARAAQFGQCYNAEGQNCVLDGDTIYFQGQKVEIAGLETPKIQDAKCDDERNRGIDSAIRLAALLNSGKVTIAGNVGEADGQVRAKVEVDGQDVGIAMIKAGAARESGSVPPSWCD